MSKSSNQKLKILHIAEIFKEMTDEEHGLTLAEIIEELKRRGISTERKSLYNDIEALRTFGMEIETKKDKTVRYYLAEVHNPEEEQRFDQENREPCKHVRSKTAAEAGLCGQQDKDDERKHLLCRRRNT